MNHKKQARTNETLLPRFSLVPTVAPAVAGANPVTHRILHLPSSGDKELKQYSDRSLRAESERELKATRQRCDALVSAMERAQRRIEPVLKPLRDRVLFLKHNLNAQAIGALDAELLTVRTNVDALIADLEAAISEADQFVAAMGSATSN